jgi:hypothetical protein
MTKNQSLVTFDANAVIYEDQVRDSLTNRMLDRPIRGPLLIPLPVVHRIEDPQRDGSTHHLGMANPPTIHPSMDRQVRFHMGPFKANMEAVAGEADVFNENGYLWCVLKPSFHSQNHATRRRLHLASSLPLTPPPKPPIHPPHTNRCSKSGFLPDRQEAKLCGILKGVRFCGVTSALLGGVALVLYLLLGFRSLKLKCVEMDR